MPKSSPMQHLQQVGSHQVWTGPTDSRGRPRAQTFGDCRVIHRPMWGAYWQVPLEELDGIRLRQACSTELCLSPVHWVVANPKRVLKLLQDKDLYHPRQRPGMTGAFDKAAHAGSLAGAWWDLELIDAPTPTRTFAPPPGLINALAVAKGVPVLAMLCIWSRLVIQEIRRRDREEA